MSGMLFPNDPRLKLTVKADGVTDDTEAFNEMVEFAQDHGLDVYVKHGMTFYGLDKLFSFPKP